MDEHLDAFARRVEEDPFFLACHLRLYAQTEGLTEQQLAALLGCPEETLVMLRLCKSPAEESEDFHTGIDQISTRFKVDPDVLAEVVRRGHAIVQLRRGTNMLGTLAAARDDDVQPDGKNRSGGDT
jgi:hypothetical protein